MSNSVVLNRGHYTVLANDVVKGKQEMSLQEARIIRLLITQISKDDKSLERYTMRIQDFAEFLGIPSSNLYRDVYAICDRLLSRKISIRTSDNRRPWRIFQWMQLAEYDGNGTLTLMLSEQLKPYVLDLKKYYTQYQLDCIINLKTFYAIRLYELLKMDAYKMNDEDEYSIDFLREFFDCEAKYKDFKDFRIRVLEPAVLEVNKNAPDIEILDVVYRRSCRKVVGLVFCVRDKIYTALPTSAFQKSL